MEDDDEGVLDALGRDLEVEGVAEKADEVPERLERV